ncbi:response regulator transcription factor [Endozoicomonas sp. G2_1]|uniref:LytR/AlgR family response regulator transcription factor n=1 Tax=Endozoicomonas sp. G2_1 TaxID=2821091 RepID=UPI001AD98B51|nr:response regulator transcription factor [Endozoicomonas sp. G2_1]
MSQQLNTLIVDDEPLARKGLKVRLSDYPEVNVVAECANGKQALEQVQALVPDLVFLDIQMPGMNGFEVVEAMMALDIEMPLIVFVTAYDQYAINAFEVHALDYLMKPADEQRLAQAMLRIHQHLADKAANQHKAQLVKLVSEVTGNDSEQILNELDNNESVSLQHYSDILAIKDAGEVSRVPVKNIMWIDAAGDYMCVHTEKGTHILRKTMKELEAILDPRMFIRCHRSVIVNKHYIDKFCSQLNGEYYLVMLNGKELKVSRSYKDKVKQLVCA